ncbi:unnamed protein product [Adineta steineri]|uniref:Ion transport domain-containing protein n=1 Tax=Adineta steineri TaxID=433720 RepID=A0A814MPM6_9BILA|nr:unnamed protein product [Adineta steineri]
MNFALVNPVQVEYNYRPQSVAVGDFNNDTWMDIVVANRATNNIAVFLGYGNAGLSSKSITYSTGTNSTPYMVAVGDFNNDGRSDIVVANYGVNNVGIFLGLGNGVFGTCNHHDTYYARLSLHSCPNKNFISFKQSATVSQTLCIWYIILYCFLNFILETIQLIQDGWDYFSDIENYIQWTLYMSTCLFTFPFLFNQSWHYQWVFGAVGVFTAYLGLLFLLGRFDVYGIYVIMFMEIFKTLLHVLSLFSILIFGFALTFCVMRPFTQDLNPANPQHLFMIVLKTVSMMLGELDYDRTYIESGEEQHFSFINLIMLLLFAVIMPILLMNLLIGLAIGDLMQIQQNARLKRLAMQVQYHTNLERKIPSKLIKRWTKDEFKIHVNRKTYRDLSTLLKHWVAKPVNTSDVLEAKDEYDTESAIFSEMYNQKQRQKGLQHQLEKVTDLVRLVVQKMEIPAEIEVNDASKSDKNEKMKKLQKFRHAVSVTRRTSQK